MSGRRRSRRLIAVGGDLGGTWIRVLALSSDGGRLRSFTGAAPDLVSLPKFLRSLFRRWRVTPAQVGALVIATRGVWTAPERRRQARRLRNLARKVTVLPDVEAAYLGALGDTPGLLVLAGTGSIVLGRNPRGRWIRRGGLGPLLGDEGSAFWIGREWLKATKRGERFETLRPLVRFPDAAARVARAAVRVLARARTGNRIARRIVAEAQRHLALQVREVASALSLRPPIAVSWAGRLLEDRGFRAGVWRALRRGGLSLRVVPPREAPVLATARLALTLSQRR
ncbi:MAG: hypothetical protein HY726_08510 [Candidatus Rokubacteria bacterium]|nr:hypothetical protein [Candidatus Rokubacteria bacterium]